MFNPGRDDTTSTYSRNRQGSTALHLALTSGSKDSVRLLLQANADVMSTDNQGYTLLHVLLRQPVVNKKIFELLLDHEYCSRGDDGTSLDRVLQQLEPELEILVVKAGWDPLALLDAVKDRKENMVRAFLHGNITSDAVQPSTGRTALHLALSMSYTSMVKLLLSSGANPNVRDLVSGETALHIAVRLNNDRAALQLLLKANADPNIQDARGWTALHTAVWCVANGHKDVLSTLLSSSRCAIDIRARNGETAMEFAARRADKKAMAIFAQHLFQGTLEVCEFVSSVKSKCLIQHPLTLSRQGLFKTIYDSVSNFYRHLDRLERSGFALGYDCLSNDITLANPRDKPIFSGRSFLLLSFTHVT